VVFSLHYISYPLKINTNKKTLSCTLNAFILFQLFEFMNKTEIIFFVFALSVHRDVIVFDLVNRYSVSAGQLSLDRGLYFRVVCLATEVFMRFLPQFHWYPAIL